MNLSELKNALQQANEVSFRLPNGKSVPSHFHITEIGEINKNFIDCGGTMRSETKISLQLWTSIDFHHRLKAEKLLQIIAISEKQLQISNATIEVEFQAENTIQKYGLNFDGDTFQLTNTQTACLALDSCGIPVEKVKVKLNDLTKAASDCCTPGGGCC